MTYFRILPSTTHFSRRKLDMCSILLSISLRNKQKIQHSLLDTWSIKNKRQKPVVKIVKKAGFQGFHYGLGNWQIDQPDVKSILLSWFDHHMENSSCKEFQINSQACMWKPVALLLTALMKPLATLNQILMNIPADSSTAKQFIAQVSHDSSLIWHC